MCACAFFSFAYLIIQAEDRSIDYPLQYEGDIALTKDDVSFLYGGPTPETVCIIVDL